MKKISLKKNGFNKFIVVLVGVLALSVFNQVKAQDIYATKFYKEFYKYFSYSSEQKGNYFFSLKITTGDDGEIINQIVSNNLDPKMTEKMAFVLGHLDISSLKPFLNKNSMTILPIFIIYQSGDLTVSNKPEDNQIWNFGQNLKEEKYSLLPPIIYRDFKRIKVIN